MVPKADIDEAEQKYQCESEELRKKAGDAGGLDIGLCAILLNSGSISASTARQYPASVAVGQPNCSTMQRMMPSRDIRPVGKCTFFSSSPSGRQSAWRVP